MDVHSVVCVRIKGGEKECFRIDIGMRQGCTMSPWLFNVHMDGVRKEVEVWMRRGEGRNCLASFMQMTWYCVASWRKT